MRFNMSAMLHPFSRIIVCTAMAQMSRSRACDSIGERADFDAPYLYPQGIDYVIVNGKIAVENGEVADGRAGQVLRRRHE